MDVLLIQEIAESSGEEDGNNVIDFDDDLAACLLICDGDSNLLNIVKKEPRLAIKNYVEEIVSEYNDIEFITHFRLNRQLVENISNLYEDSEIFSSVGVHGGPAVIRPYKQLLVFLWYVGHETGGFAEMKEKFDLSYRTLFNIIDRVSQFICTLQNEVMKFPDEEEKLSTSSFYFNSNHFPGIIGSLDGTHIRIDKPAEDPDSYVNRKKFFSLNLQGLVNHKGKFIDVFCGYPGSVHDARVFKCSPLYQQLPNLCDGDIPRYILGDSAYPCLKYLIVPYKDNGHLTNAQKRFNTRLSQCRVTVEHSFGIFKQRFRKMYHLNVRKRERQLRIIYSCCILHNLADEEDLVHLEQPLPEEVQMEADPGVNPNVNNLDEIFNEVDENGRDLRDHICDILN